MCMHLCVCMHECVPVSVCVDLYAYVCRVARSRGRVRCVAVSVHSLWCTLHVPVIGSCRFAGIIIRVGAAEHGGRRGGGETSTIADLPTLCGSEKRENSAAGAGGRGARQRTTSGCYCCTCVNVCTGCVSVYVHICISARSGYACLQGMRVWNALVNVFFVNAW